MRSELIIGGFCSRLDEYHGALNLLLAWRTERCVLRDQRVCAGQELGAQKQLLNSFLLSREKSRGKKNLWVEKVLLLFRCLMK